MVKKCPKCGAVWYSELPKCAFCGVEAELQPMSTHTGRLPEKPVPAAEPKPERPVLQTAVAEATPIPPTSADATPPVEKIKEKPVPLPVAEVAQPAPLPAPVQEAKPAVPEKAAAPAAPPVPGLTPLAPGERKPNRATLPPAPRVPSSKLPVLLALLGVLACIVLPMAVFMELGRILSIMAYLAGSLLLPLAPISWYLGRRYEDRCIDLGYKPANFGKVGRVMGMTVTILISLEGSVLAFLAALRLISGKL